MWFSQVKRISSTDEFLPWKEGPDGLRGAWKAKFYTVKPWRERSHPQEHLLKVHFTHTPQSRWTSP